MDDKTKNEINQIMAEFGQCSLKLNNKTIEFWLELKNGVINAQIDNEPTVSFYWSLYQKKIYSLASTVSKGIYEIFRELNDMPAIRSLKKEIQIFFFLMNCFDHALAEISITATKMSKPINATDLGSYIETIKNTNHANALSRWRQGEFQKKAAIRPEIGRIQGPTFSLKIHYISEQRCEIEVYMANLESKYAEFSSPLIDINPIYENRVWTNYRDNSSIYFQAKAETTANALEKVIKQIQKHFTSKCTP